MFSGIDLAARAGRIFGGKGGQHGRLAATVGIAGTARAHGAFGDIYHVGRCRDVRLANRQLDDFVAGAFHFARADMDSPFVGAKSGQTIGDRRKAHHVAPPSALSEIPSTASIAVMPVSANSPSAKISPARQPSSHRPSMIALMAMAWRRVWIGFRRLAGGQQCFADQGLQFIAKAKISFAVCHCHCRIGMNQCR